MKRLLGICLIALAFFGCVEGKPPSANSTTSAGQAGLREYEVVWHKVDAGSNNQTSTVWYKEDYEVKEFFVHDVIVKITRIEPNGERIVVCSVYDGTACQ